MPNLSANHAPEPANPLPWLHCARALAPLRFTEVALARIGPSAPIVIKDFAQFVEHFRSNPDPPAGKSFACSSGRAFLFPSNTHRGNFEQVRSLNFRFRHNLECYLRLLKNSLSVSGTFAMSFFESAMNLEVWAGESVGNVGRAELSQLPIRAGTCPGLLGIASFHIPDDGLPTIVHMDMLDTDKIADRHCTAVEAPRPR